MQLPAPSFPPSRPSGSPRHRTPHRLGGVFVLGALLPYFSGCESVSPPRADPAAHLTTGTATQPNPFGAVTKGMTADQVRRLAGNPGEIRPFKEGEHHSEVWIYQRVISRETRQVAVTTREVPLTNPLTGVTGTVAEPVMSNEFITTSEITELLMIDGRLIEWKRKPQVDRKID